MGKRKRVVLNCLFTRLEEDRDLLGDAVVLSACICLRFHVWAEAQIRATLFCLPTVGALRRGSWVMMPLYCDKNKSKKAAKVQEMWNLATNN